MALSNKSKECICTKEYSVDNPSGVEIKYKVNGVFNCLSYEQVPGVIGLYGKNNVYLINIDIEEFKKHFEIK